MNNLKFNDYKYVVVGAGFFGSVIAERIANELNQKVLVIEKRDHIGGNCYSKVDEETGIIYHAYGPHIFHTSDKKILDYLLRFTELNGYFHQVLTTYQGKVFQMPINLETINSFYNINLKPYEVEDFLRNEVKKDNIVEPKNLEEKAISLIGRKLYEAFIRGYTMKQWQKDPRELPEAIINRLPVRSSYNENYFFDKWQGVPEGGYTPIFEKMLSSPKITVALNTDFFKIKNIIPESIMVVYGGPIDKYFDYKYGPLEWRSLKFTHEIKEVADFQGISQMNFAEENIPYTRIFEPKHLHPECKMSKSKTLIIKEYPATVEETDEPYYPIGGDKNNKILSKYLAEADKLRNCIFGGRLGDYKYYDMDKVIRRALEIFEAIKLKK